MKKVLIKSVSIIVTAFLLGGCGLRTYERVGAEVSQESNREPAIQIDVPETEAEVKIKIETAQPKETQPEETQPEETSPGGEATMVFAGDVYLSDHVLGAYDRAGGISGVLDAAFRSSIRDADVFFVNEEFPFSTNGTAADKTYTFRLDPKRVNIFKELGVDGVTLANNHALDFGAIALLDSCQVLDTAGIPHTGAGENLSAARQAVTYEVSGQKIAVIGASRVFPYAEWAAGASHAGMLSAYDPAALIKEIQTLRQTQDYVIVYIHWGTEREERPNEIQKNLGRQLIDAGADLVIGSHPHVLQGIEYYKEKPIVYSLGNFIFGSSIPRTALLEIKLPDKVEGKPELRLIPGTSAAGFTHQFDSEQKKQEFYQYMTGISYGVQIDAQGNVSAVGTSDAS